MENNSLPSIDLPSYATMFKVILMKAILYYFDDETGAYRWNTAELEVYERPNRTDEPISLDNVALPMHSCLLCSFRL